MSPYRTCAPRPAPRGFRVTRLARAAVRLRRAAMRAALLALEIADAALDSVTWWAP